LEDLPQIMILGSLRQWLWFLDLCGSVQEMFNWHETTARIQS